MIIFRMCTVDEYCVIYKGMNYLLKVYDYTDAPSPTFFVLDYNYNEIEGRVADEIIRTYKHRKNLLNKC